MESLIKKPIRPRLQVVATRRQLRCLVVVVDGCGSASASGGAVVLAKSSRRVSVSRSFRRWVLSWQYCGGHGARWSSSLFIGLVVVPVVVVDAKS